MRRKSRLEQARACGLCIVLASAIGMTACQTENVEQDERIEREQASESEQSETARERLRARISGRDEYEAWAIKLSESPSGVVVPDELADSDRFWQRVSSRVRTGLRNMSAPDRYARMIEWRNAGDTIKEAPGDSMLALRYYRVASEFLGNDPGLNYRIVTVCVALRLRGEGLRAARRLIREDESAASDPHVRELIQFLESLPS